MQFIFRPYLQDKLSFKRRTNRTAGAIKWLQKNKDKAFYVVVDDGNFEDNVAAIMKSTGLGKLRPNVIMLGFKNDWMACPVADLNGYYNVIQWVNMPVVKKKIPGRDMKVWE